MGLGRSRSKNSPRVYKRRLKYSLKFIFGVTFVMSGLAIIIISILLNFG
jgi:hypothetical protein